MITFVNIIYQSQKLRRSKQRMGFFPEMETPEKCPKFSKNC